MALDRKYLLAVGTAMFVVLAIREFVPSVPLLLIPHESAELPQTDEEPWQVLRPNAEPIERPRDIPVRLHPRADFEISAEVVGIERYRFDGAAFAIPWDVALIWGDLRHPPFRGAVDYHQNGRFVIWGTENMELDPHYITAHCANVHVVPASSRIHRALRHVRAGDLVRMTGELVDLEGLSSKEGFRWRTSLSRTDTNDGSCETIFLRELVVGDRLYR